MELKPHPEIIRGFEFESFGEAQSTIDRFMDFYNNKRLHSAIGYVTPKETERNITGWWMQKRQVEKLVVSLLAIKVQHSCATLLHTP